MNAAAAIDALGIPAGARVDRRVSKKAVIDHGATTAGDRRAINEGVEELEWVAACKPNTIGVPEYRDNEREYLEIAVLTAVFRPGAKPTRLVDLIHRAIPYPVLLLTTHPTGLSVSVAHKRRALNDPSKVTIEGVVSTAVIDPGDRDEVSHRFVESLTIARLPSSDLFTLYDGWLARIEAHQAARFTGVFRVKTGPEAILRRREALAMKARMEREMAGMRAAVAKERQVSRQVEINLKIKRLEAEVAIATRDL